MTNETPILELSELAATRPGGDLLGPVSFSLAHRTSLSLVGPAGAGREDLLDLISGRTQARSGSIRLDGRDLAGQTSNQRIAAGLVRCRFDRHLPHFASLREWLNITRLVLENRAGTLCWKPALSIDRGGLSDLLAVLEFSGLGDVADGPLDKLSPDQARLAMLACALMQRPRLLILERPFAGMEPDRREAWTRQLVRLKRDGVSLIILDDCPAWMAECCDQMAVMAHGRVIAHGPPDLVGDQAPAIEALTGLTGLP